MCILITITYNTFHKVVYLICVIPINNSIVERNLLINNDLRIIQERIVLKNEFNKKKDYSAFIFAENCVDFPTVLLILNIKI